MHNGFLYSASEYKTFLPLLTDPIKDYTVANKYATLYMKMQVEVFGTKSFKITDEELFKYKIYKQVLKKEYRSWVCLIM